MKDDEAIPFPQHLSSSPVGLNVIILDFHCMMILQLWDTRSSNTVTDETHEIQTFQSAHDLLHANPNTCCQGTYKGWP